ncbi:MAG: hypothetical protein M0R40_00570 [Firmicutes bacterium]|nr:hypothetical protein [Bacillota bacterium]
MKAIDYLKIKNRMTKNCEIACDCCPLSDLNNGEDEWCDTLENYNPEKAIAIVKKWGEENPVKTYMMDFMEKFTKAEKLYDYHGKERPAFCRDAVYARGKRHCEGKPSNCYRCWNEEMRDDNA